MAKRNPRTGSRFYDFLKDEGIFEEVQAKALTSKQSGYDMSPQRLLKPDDALFAWRERLLDAYVGLGRNSPGYD